MQYIKGLESYKAAHKTAITLGKFDGLHRGHKKLIDQIRYYATGDIKSVVFAFDMKKFFRIKGIEKKSIMTNVERYLKLEQQVDYLIECPFTENIHCMKAEDFISEVLVKQFHAAYIVVGTDYHFGYEKKGDIHMLKQYADRYGYQVNIVEKETYEGRVISSTYIKDEVTKGNIELANILLGYSYCIRGRVEHGRKLARSLGMPTMNITPNCDKLLPPNGVYECKVLIDGIYYDGIGNIGTKPTVTRESKIVLEVFLLQYNDEAYGKKIEIEFLHYERPELKFASIQELGAHMEQDINSGIKYFEESK